MATTHILSFNGDFAAGLKQYPQEVAWALAQVITNIADTEAVETLRTYGINYEGCHMHGAIEAMKFIIKVAGARGD
jgi:hypothetical protein